MGWKMHNVWSIDWFRNSQKELNLLVDSIEKAKVQIGHEDAV
jgi:hypothetical protein